MSDKQDSTDSFSHESQDTGRGRARGRGSIEQEADTYEREEQVTNRSQGWGWGNMNSQFNSVVTKLYTRFPTVARVLSSIKEDPFSGNTLRMLLTETDEREQSHHQVQSLRPATMWETDAPIVISQYASYSSSVLPRYWNTTLPDVEDRYDTEVRYEHHDVPVPDTSLTQYKLSTIGRAIQQHAGTEAFWAWFNAIMLDGVRSAEEGMNLVSELGIEIARHQIESAVTNDLYRNVILNDIYSLFEKVDTEQADQFERQIDNGDPVFAVFINGAQVEPSYDSIIGEVETRQALYE